MKKERIEAILQRFLGSDESRPAMQKISRVKHGKNYYACATNTHVLCLINDDKAQFKWVLDYPNVTKVIPEITNSIAVSIDTIEESFKKIPSFVVIKDEVSCQVCQGSGEIELAGHEYSCKSCDDNKQTSSKLVFECDYQLKIGEKLFSPNLFFPILSLLQIIGIEEIKIVSEIDIPMGALLIEVSEINAFILMMPMISVEDNTIIEIPYLESL